MLRETPIVDSRTICSRSGLDGEMWMTVNLEVKIDGLVAGLREKHLPGVQYLLIPVAVAYSQTAYMFTLWNVKW